MIPYIQGWIYDAFFNGPLKLSWEDGRRIYRVGPVRVIEHTFYAANTPADFIFKYGVWE